MIPSNEISLKVTGESFRRFLNEIISSTAAENQKQDSRACKSPAVQLSKFTFAKNNALSIRAFTVSPESSRSNVREG